MARRWRWNSSLNNFCCVNQSLGSFYKTQTKRTDTGAFYKSTVYSPVIWGLGWGCEVFLLLSSLKPPKSAVSEGSKVTSRLILSDHKCTVKSNKYKSLLFYGGTWIFGFFLHFQQLNQHTVHFKIQRLTELNKNICASSVASQCQYKQVNTDLFGTISLMFHIYTVMLQIQLK